MATLKLHIQQYYKTKFHLRASRGTIERFQRNTFDIFDVQILGSQTNILNYLMSS